MEGRIDYFGGRDYRRNLNILPPEDEFVTLLVKPDRTVQLIQNPRPKEIVVFETPKKHVP